MSLDAVIQFLGCLGDVDMDLQVMLLGEPASPDDVVFPYSIDRVNADFEYVERVPVPGPFVHCLAVFPLTFHLFLVSKIQENKGMSASQPHFIGSLDR